MRIAFVQFAYYEYLGIMYLSASLKRHGHSTSVFINRGMQNTGRFVDSLLAWRPDIVAFSVMTGSEVIALSIARQIKDRSRAYSVFGGPHPTLVPGIIEDKGVDCVCIGESEKALAGIADLLTAGRMPEHVEGAWCKVRGEIIKNDIGPLTDDLETLPRPDRTLYRGKYRLLRSKQTVFITGRGCPYKCTFCSNHALQELYRGKGPYVRQRPVDDVIDEIREVKIDGNLRTVYFQDDTFIMNRKWVLEFCEAYQREIGLPFSCHIRADLASVEVVAALAAAKCRTVAFGIETGDAGMRNRLLSKEVTDEQILFCAELLRKHGIRYRTLNMLGLPGETLAGSFLTVALNSRVHADYPSCSLYHPLPGTKLRAYCATNDLFEGGIQRTQLSFLKDSSLALKNKREIVNLQKLFFYAVKFPVIGKLIRRAIRVRPNAGYEALFAAAHAWVYFRSNMVAMGDLLAIALMNAARYLPRTRGGAGKRAGGRE